MPADPWDEIEDAFTRGLHASEVERAALLANLDGEVAVRVRSLWADSERAGSFLERGVVASARAVSHSPGELIGGRFRLVDFLGAGGMGEVFRARDEQLGRSVALKFLYSELASQEDTRHRLEHEARAICSLSHPHICTLYDIGWEGNAPFLVMEYLAGETLGDTLSRGPLSLNEIAALALQMIDGLAHAHEAGIVHRDFKPGNVMLTRQGVKIFDFGIAKQLHTESAANPSTTLTNAGAIVGSASYMSPEQAQAKPIDARSDIFSLGCVLYEMITGRKAFGGDSPISTLAAVLHSDPVPIRRLVPGTPASLIELVEKCLKKNVEDRYQRLDEVRRAMAELSSAAPAVAGTTRSREEPSFASAVLRLAGNRPIMIGVIVALISLGAFSFLYLTSASLEATDSIAVLPFANVEKDTNLDYLADGLSESITNTLSRLGSVRVIARATAFAYEGKDADVRKVGQELKVRTIVTGKVSRTRDHFRVQAELVDARAGNQMWGQHYEGTSADMLRVQDDIVRNVSQRLHVDVSDASRQELTRTSTAKPEAYELYLRGRYALSRSTVADTQKSIEFFQQAFRVDPTYPLAYAGLADSYLGLSGMYLKPKEAMAKARAAATRAIELDPRLVEAHVSKGVIQMFHDFAWRGSEEEFKRAIELKPHDASARLWYAWNLVLTGRPDDAIAQALRAHELDPLSAYIEAGLAQMYYCAGQPQTAIQRLGSVVGADPNFFNGRYLLGVAYLYTAQYADAIRELEHATRLDPQQPQPIGYLVYAYAKQGDLPSARARLGALKTLSESRYVSGYVFAVASVGIGADEEAIQWLQKAYDDRDDMLSVLKVDSPFAGLRSDQRVVSLLRQIGLD